MTIKHHHCALSFLYTVYLWLSSLPECLVLASSLWYWPDEVWSLQFCLIWISRIPAINKLRSAMCSIHTSVGSNWFEVRGSITEMSKDILVWLDLCESCLLKMPIYVFGNSSTFWIKSMILSFSLINSLLSSGSSCCAAFTKLTSLIPGAFVLSQSQTRQPFMLACLQFQLSLLSVITDMS